MPAASEPTTGAAGGSGLPSLPRTWRPTGVRFAVIGFGVMLVVVCAACWFGFDESVRERFSWLQRITVLAMGAGLATCGLALARARVTAQMDGMVVVNGFRTRTLAWEEVLAVHLPAGAPWATAVFRSRSSPMVRASTVVPRVATPKRCRKFRREM